MSSKRRKELGIAQLPRTLKESLKHLEESIFMKDVLGEDIVNL